MIMHKGDYCVGVKCLFYVLTQLKLLLKGLR